MNPLQIAVALALAVLYTQKFAGVRFLRSLVILPIAVPPAVSAAIWSVAYRPDGMLNAVLHVLGIPQQPFLTSPQQALWCLIVLLSWIGVGYWMMFLIAGMQDIPVDSTRRRDRRRECQARSCRDPPAAPPAAGVRACRRHGLELPRLRPGPDPDQRRPAGLSNLTMFDIFTRAYAFGASTSRRPRSAARPGRARARIVRQFRLLRANGRASLSELAASSASLSSCPCCGC